MTSVPGQNSESTAALFDRCVAGDGSAAEDIHDRFAEKLRRVAAGLIGVRLRQRADADDALQSAFRTFFSRAMRGEFTISQSGQLWRLLARITERKVQKLVERHTAGKRDVGREAIGDIGISPALHDQEEPPDAIAALHDEVEGLMKRLTERDGTILCRALLGEKPPAIAREVSCSAHTVRRVLHRSGQLLAVRLQHSWNQAPTENGKRGA